MLALDPKLLLFDEPLSNLDAKLRGQMRHEIRKLQKEVGVTTLFVTHDQDEALTMADRVVVLNQGRIEQIGTPVEIYEHPRTRFVADFIGTSNFLDGSVTGGQAERAVFTSSARLARRTRRIAAHAMRAGVLAIRPRRSSSSSRMCRARIEARISDVTRLAGMIEYVLTLDTGDDIMIREQRRPGV